MKQGTHPVARFGAFEADFQTGELRKSGIRIKIQDQPMRVLSALLQHPGEVVTREELQELLCGRLRAMALAVIARKAEHSDGLHRVMKGINGQ